MKCQFTSAADLFPYLPSKELCQIVIDYTALTECWFFCRSSVHPDMIISGDGRTVSVPHNPNPHERYWAAASWPITVGGTDFTFSYSKVDHAIGSVSGNYGWTRRFVDHVRVGVICRRPNHFGARNGNGARHQQHQQLDVTIPESNRVPPGSFYDMHGRYIPVQQRVGTHSGTGTGIIRLVMSITPQRWKPERQRAREKLISAAATDPDRQAYVVRMNERPDRLALTYAVPADQSRLMPYLLIGSSTPGNREHLYPCIELSPGIQSVTIS